MRSIESPLCNRSIRPAMNLEQSSRHTELMVEFDRLEDYSLEFTPHVWARLLQESLQNPLHTCRDGHDDFSKHFLVHLPRQQQCSLSFPCAIIPHIPWEKRLAPQFIWDQLKVTWSLLKMILNVSDCEGSFESNKFTCRFTRNLQQGHLRTWSHCLFHIANFAAQSASPARLTKHEICQIMHHKALQQ